MLTLAFILGSSIVFAYVREYSPETYRCPYCSQIEIGAYHRFKCLILNGQVDNILFQSERRHQSYRQEASQGMTAEKNGALAVSGAGHKNRILAFLPGFLSQRSAVKNLTVDLNCRVHLASRAC